MLFSISQKLIQHQIYNYTEILKWLRDILTCHNNFLHKHKDYANRGSNIPICVQAHIKLEVSSVRNAQHRAVGREGGGQGTRQTTQIKVFGRLHVSVKIKVSKITLLRFEKGEHRQAHVRGWMLVARTVLMQDHLTFVFTR